MNLISDFPPTPLTDTEIALIVAVCRFVRETKLPAALAALRDPPAALTADTPTQGSA